MSTFRVCSPRRHCNQISRHSWLASIKVKSDQWYDIPGGSIITCARSSPQVKVWHPCIKMTFLCNPWRYAQDCYQSILITEKAFPSNHVGQVTVQLWHQLSICRINNMNVDGIWGVWYSTRLQRMFPICTGLDKIIY